MKTNYRVQEPRRECRNCKNCFLWLEFDEISKPFCNLSANKRPRSGSVLMNEEIFGVVAYSKWEAWANEHKVDPNGICDDYEEG